MTLKDIPCGMVIDCADDNDVDLGFFVLLRETYGERANPETNHMVLDFSGLSPRQTHEERGWVRHLFDLR